MAAGPLDFRDNSGLGDAPSMADCMNADQERGSFLHRFASLVVVVGVLAGKERVEIQSNGDTPHGGLRRRVLIQRVEQSWREGRRPLISDMSPRGTGSVIQPPRQVPV